QLFIPNVILYSVFFEYGFNLVDDRYPYRTYVLNISPRNFNLCFYSNQSLLQIHKTKVHLPRILELFRKAASNLCRFLVFEFYFYETFSKSSLNQLFFLYLDYETQVVKLYSFMLNKLAQTLEQVYASWITDQEFLYLD